MSCRSVWKAGLLVGLHLCVASSVRAQSPAQTAGIAGHVTRGASGLPLEGATVELVPPVISGNRVFPTAIAGADGSYSFSGVRAGTYTIQARAKGFVPKAYSRHGALYGDLVQVGEGAQLEGIDFQLDPEARLEGAVVNAAGQAVEAGVFVAAVQKETRADGSEGLRAVATAKTDAQGRFALVGLPEGSYLVCVNGPHGEGLRSGVTAGYKESWYGAGGSAEGAVAVPVREGQSVGGLVIQVELERYYNVTVRPSGPGGKVQVGWYSVSLRGRSRSSIQRGDGSYLIPEVPEGHYTVDVTAWMEATYVGAGEAEFDVKGGDVAVEVAVGGLGEIAGVVQVEGGGLVPALMLAVQSENGAAQSRAVGADGSFRVDKVLPGPYTFRLLGEPGGVELQGVRCGGAVVSKEEPLRVGDREKVEGCEVRAVRR